MKKINVVKSNEDFNDILKTGKCIKNRYFVIHYKCMIFNNIELCFEKR